MPNAALFASLADAVAPGNSPKEKYAFDPPAATGAKVVLIDSDHNESDRTDPLFAWRSFLRGYNPIVMDWWNGPRWDPLRRALGDTRKHAEKMNLAAMTPRNDLVSTTYCLANPGKEYLVLQPAAEAPFTVNLQPGRYRLEWFRPDTAKVEKTDEIQASGGVQGFKPPFAGPAVLYLAAILHPGGIGR